ncbi:MAG: HpcH/HpaI aldolase/citrate lyase family protein [Leifsonia sp.]
MNIVPNALSDTGPVSSSRAQVSPLLARSWLLVPANKPATFEAATRSPADAVVMDLEDAVDPSCKAEARDALIAWMARGGEAWVRINDATTSFWAEDLAAVSGNASVKGVMLAKVEDPGQLTDTFLALEGKKPVVALIESAVGIERATDIACAEGAFRLAFGSGDFRRDTGMSSDKEAMAYPRARLVVASRCGGLPGPIDGPTVGSSHPILREQSATTVTMGMTGKLCLSPDQAPIVNEVISPAPSDVAWARQFLDQFQARSGVVLDGSDLPRLGRARKILDLAEAFSVMPS